MGGVDLTDINSWLLYRKVVTDRKEILPLCEFTAEVENVYVELDRDIRAKKKKKVLLHCHQMQFGRMVVITGLKSPKREEGNLPSLNNNKTIIFQTRKLNETECSALEAFPKVLELAKEDNT
ncbi:hypothetical protein ILUMI_04437 [Ignelater luminosus]|uniref:Uncharacterized protein n=1 Tax=Ignelater luminosus TaxID=2038154 RepID=A0A8K0DCL6_IGNLU|nr:hypothetical protein ILUMI_04437 [Ignelater luminosus]